MYNELMMSLPHNFQLILFKEIKKILYFSYEKVKLALSILNKCKIIFALICLIYGDMLLHVLAKKERRQCSKFHIQNIIWKKVR